MAVSSQYFGELLLQGGFGTAAVIVPPPTQPPMIEKLRMAYKIAQKRVKIKIVRQLFISN
jgi:hypothetical protein